VNGEAGQRWDPTTLGVACEINPPKPKLAGLPDDTPIMFVPMAAVDDVAGVVAAPEQRALGEVRSKSYRTFSSQDVIFAKITPCMENGKCSVVPDIPTGLGFGSTEFHVLRPRPGVNPRFIWYYVRQESFRRLAEDHMTGSVGQLRVPVSFLQDSPILLPPETVQNEIVRILDGATMSGRSASGHLATAQRAIERFRHVALAASEDAPAFRLEDLLEEPMRNGYSALPTNTVTPFRVLTLTATTSGWFEEHHFKYTAEEFTKDSPFWVRPADILVQRGNTAEYVGVPALYEGEGHQF
jgi:hypothetical protein